MLASNAYIYTERYGITCSNPNVAFDEPASLSGLAKDGFPLYGPFDSVDGVYHYHALQDAAPNIPTCLMGSFVEQGFLIDGRAR